MIERSIMVRWVDGSIPHVGRKEGKVIFNDALNTFYLRLCGVGPHVGSIKLISFQLVIQDCGMAYHVCVMMHIKDI